jgi:hypothetical protein
VSTVDIKKLEEQVEKILGDKDLTHAQPVALAMTDEIKKLIADTLSDIIKKTRGPLEAYMVLQCCIMSLEKMTGATFHGAILDSDVAKKQ